MMPVRIWKINLNMFVEMLIPHRLSELQGGSDTTKTARFFHKCI